MTKFLDEVMREAKSIDLGKFKPMDEIGPGDRVVGEADDACKRLYVLAKEYKRRGAEKRGEANTTQFIESSSKRHLLEEARKMEQKANVVMEIFQASVRHVHELWDDKIGVRKGWMIVRIAIDEVPNAKHFLFNTRLGAR